MANFYLSHWSDPQKVFVPEEIQVKLKQYHFSIVRSLYRSIQKKYTGGILNYDEGINIPLAFQALWQALITVNRIKLPILVIASDNTVVEWHYHLSQIGEIIILNSQNCERVVENSDFLIILVPECNLKLLQPFRENEFSFVVIEDFDLIATKVLFKKLSGEFNVALTKRNFMIDRDCKILWHILNWISPGEFGKLNNFADFDRDHLENLRNPYDEIWHSYNYNVGDYNLDDVEDEKKEYQETLKKWAKKNNLPFENNSNKITRKRKSNFPSGKAVKTKKCSEISEDDMYDAEYHENETQLVKDVLNAKNYDVRDSYEVKGIRDVTDLCYSKLIREEVKIVSEKENEEKSSIKSPFLKNQNVNMKRRTFKFLDNENNISAEKQLKQIDSHVKSRMACRSEGADNIDRTCATCSNLIKKVSASVVCVNRKEAESLEKSNINTSIMNSNIEMENHKTPLSKEDVKEAKDTLILPSDHVTYKSASASVDIHKQIFPSLEDILTFKKKDIGDMLLVRKHAMQIKESAIRERALKSIQEKKFISNNLERQSIASLEEVFKCKRKLNGMPEVTKKVNVESPISANYNNMLMKFNHQDRLKRMKLYQPHRIMYKNIPISNISYESVELVSKATQTSNELMTTTSYKSSCSRPEDTVITLEMGIRNENFKDKSMTMNELTNTRVSRGNSKEKLFEKPINGKLGSDSITVERKNDIAKRKSTLVSQESSLKDSMNVVNEGNVEDEDKELLLSIVEGRFVSQPAIDSDHFNNNIKEKSTKSENDTTSKTFKRYNSRTLLGALFGDDAECLEDKKLDENSACKNKIVSEDRFSAVDDLKSASQPHHLKVRTIDQINGDNSGRKSICQSLKYLLGVDGKDDNSSNRPGGKNFGASYYDRHNFSTLFG